MELPEIERVGRAVLRVTKISRLEPPCPYCLGEGQIEMDNNGPIVACPICTPPQ